MAYHKFESEGGEKYGSFETFYTNEEEAKALSDDTGNDYGPGWYWWACFPGCMPDSEPHGPFATEQEAIDSAQEKGG